MTTRPKPIRVRFLTQTDEQGASARLRVYSYVNYLAAEGLQITVDPANTEATTIGYARTALQRMTGIVETAALNDVIVIQRDFVNHMVPWIEWLYAKSGRPLILDVDDAIDLRPPGHPEGWRSKLLGTDGKLESLARMAHTVVAGNHYLAGRIREWNPNVQVIPTCLDLSAWPRPAPRRLPAGRPIVIGWIGSPLTTFYLGFVKEALRGIAARRQIVFRTVGATALSWEGVPLEQRIWRAETELAEIEQFDIGIMPLTDDEWSRGKCGTKIIQYFAAAVPVVASPVGMNVDALDGGKAGLLASTTREWTEAFDRLLGDPGLYTQLSVAGRDRAETQYDLRRYVPLWSEIIHKAAER